MSWRFKLWIREHNHTSNCFTAIYYDEGGRKVFNKRSLLYCTWTFRFEMLDAHAVSKLAKGETEPESSDDIESSDAQTKPGEWGDGL